MTAAAKTNAYVPVITLLRAIAGLGVCAVHMHYASNFALNTFLGKIITSGQQGVPMFFVISGFVIPYSLWNSNYSIRNFRQYIVKRSIRIDPPYLLTLFFCVINLYIINKQVDFVRILYHLFYLIPFTTETWYQGIFWTLGIEFQFYILIGLTFGLLKTGNIWLVIGTLLCLSAAGYFISFPNAVGFITSHIHCFCIGIICVLSKKERISLALTHILLLTITAYLCMQISYMTGFVPYFTAITILHIKFESPLSNFFGKISYSLYVTHLITGALLIKLLAKFQIPLVSLFIILMIGCVCGAYFFYLLIEKPAIIWSQKFGNKKNAHN